MKAQLSANTWEVEVPRYDSAGNPINPLATTSPTDWPVITCKMEGKFKINWNCGCDPYDAVGPVLIQVFGVTKASVQALYDQIAALWASASNWQDVNLSPAGDDSNPFYVVEMLLSDFWIGQEEGVRLKGQQLSFRGDLVYNPCRVHGAVSTS